MVKAVLRTCLWLVLLSVLTLGIALQMARPLVAAACPSCFGFSQAAPGLYLQSSMAPALRTQAATALAVAEQRVGTFFGGLQHTPRVLVCADETCYRHIGGIPGSGTGTAGSLALVVSPAALNAVPIAEALTEVELRGRVGYLRMTMGALPMWFDQGVAILAADDTLYIAHSGGRLRCLAGPVPDMPVTPEDWNASLQQEGQVTYARSACQTDIWMESHGGPAGIVKLLAEVSGGQSFDSLYKP